MKGDPLDSLGPGVALLRTPLAPGTILIISVVSFAPELVPKLLCISSP